MDITSVVLGGIVWTCYDEVCYHKNEDAMSWTDAADYCNELEGVDSVLASIHSDETNEVIASRLCYDANCWIGLQWVGGNDEWGYEDGSTVDYYSWDSGEPNGKTDGQCVYMYRGNSEKAGLWNDNGCWWSSPDALCMIAAPTDTPSQSPSSAPTDTLSPSKSPSVGPTTMVPSAAPTTLLRPTVSPTVSSSVGPITMVPTLAPNIPVGLTVYPTVSPPCGTTTMVPSEAPTRKQKKYSFNISFGVMELLIIVCAIIIAIILCLCFVRRMFLDLRIPRRRDCELEIGTTQGPTGGKGKEAGSPDIRSNDVSMASGPTGL